MENKETKPVKMKYKDYWGVFDKDEKFLWAGTNEETKNSVKLEEGQTIKNIEVTIEIRD